MVNRVRVQATILQLGFYVVESLELCSYSRLDLASFTRMEWHSR